MRFCKLAGALLGTTAMLALPTASSGAPSVIESFSNYIKARPAPTTPTGPEILPMVQNGATTGLTITQLSAYLVANLPIPAMLGYTPLNAAGGTMTGNLFAPVLGTGATVARTLSDRVADAYSVLDFGAKCDGTTDDSVSIQAAMNAAASLGAELTVAPPGKTCRAQQLTYQSNAILDVYGTLLGLGDTSKHVFLNAPLPSGHTFMSNVTIRGTGTIDNNQSTNPGTGNSCLTAGVPIHNLTVSGITMQRCGTFPVNIAAGVKPPAIGSQHVYLSYITVLTRGIENSSQFAVGCDDCWVDHSRFENNPFNVNGDFTWTFYGYNTNSGITNSRIIGGAMSIGVLSDGNKGVDLTSFPSSNILIQGNELSDADSCAVWVQGSSTVAADGVAYKQKGIRIVANDMHGNNRGHHPNLGGECILDATGTVSTANMIHDDGIAGGTATPSAGIYLYDTGSTVPGFDNFTSMGDTIYNEGSGGGGTGLGVVIGHQGGYPSFYNDRFFDNQPTHTMSQGFNGTCDITCTIIGSKFDGSIATPNGLIFNGSATVALNGAGFPAYIPGNNVYTGVSTFTGGAVMNSAVTMNGNNILGFDPTLGYTVSSDPAGTITNGAFVRLFGSTNSGAPGVLQLGGKSVSLIGPVAAPNLATSGGTVKGTLCIDTTGAIYVKTTTGPCL